MNKNNIDTQIEGGLILIKNLQCIIISEKVERSLANRLMSRFLLKDSEKILLEIEFNGMNKQTIPSLATSSSDNTTKKVAWDEHIHFKIDAPLNPSRSNELTIRCWNTSIKGYDGCLGQISEALINFDKSGEPRITLTLREGNPNIKISFSLYFLSNVPPPEMKLFDDDSIRDKKIGMILINNIKYKNILGHSGTLEFILQKALNTSGHWHTIPIVHNSSHQKQLEWKYPIAMFLKAGPDKLIIRFKHGIRGHAEVKIGIGPTGELMSIWSDLSEGGHGNGKKVGDYTLMEKERGCEEIEITFDLSCHSIVTSRDIFKEKRKSSKPPPPPPPPRRVLSYRSINRPQEPIASSSLNDHRPQEYQNFEQNERQRKPSLQENIIVPENHRLSNLLLTKSFDPNDRRSESLKSQSDSLNSSKMSESSKQKTGQQIINNNLNFGEPYYNGNNGNGASYVITEEPRTYFEEENSQVERDPSITSRTSSSRSQQNQSFHKKSKPLDIINKGKNKFTSRNTDQHVKIGYSPPSLQDYQIGSFIYEDSDGKLQSNLYQSTKQNILPNTPQDNEPSPIPQTDTIYPNTRTINNDNSNSLPKYIYNKYQLISQIPKSKQNKVYLGQHILTSDKVVVKFYKSRSRWENETHFLKALTSKSTVKLEEITVNPAEEQNYFIITRYFGKSLDEIVENIRDNKTHIKSVLLGTCKAVEWCHSKGVVHMDLNPSNIICKDQKIHKIVLCDFEHSKNAGDNICSDKYNQPLQLGFTSPELLFLHQVVSSSASQSSYSPSSYSSTTSSTYYTSKSHPETLLVKQSIDIFSLGCIFYFLNKTHLLYNSQKELEQLNLTKVCEDIEDEQVSILVKCMVAENGSKRPNITQILENPYLKN
ncbi:uncharacterized protein OCT59_019302 [Rhizophagus irregularis]|uniref:Snf1p n=1 Tax=Rhizophagus irregularis (strain DAOM 197198w) TaxID=1432141 RepID=A0A015IHB2_RHIIW|nr:Snf1p [Rhizophagus irregularis DAOM 197198w]UZO27094.1 hypothetical protein OCT59_019302 [Rhizophagus irregularis]GBC33740.1 Stk1 family PASTA domain-containing Ser/Thr kinase [Rhizophagus irregularis DAOM 181602=DAOM 197198]